MVKDEDSLKNLLINVIDFLRAKIKLNHVILFGSYTSGTANEFSDIDIAVVSADFDKMDLEQKASLAAEIKLKCSKDIELHPFGLNSLREAGPTNFLGFILDNGTYYVKDKKLVA